MATRLNCPTMPASSDGYPSAYGEIHKLPQGMRIILDFLWFAKFTWGGPVADSLTRRALTDRPSRKILCRVTTFARRPKAVARPGDPPQSEHVGSPCVSTMTGAASGKETPMAKTPRTGPRRRFSRLGEKSLTRRGLYTLRLYFSCDNAGTQSAFSLIHGATDANG